MTIIQEIAKIVGTDVSRPRHERSNVRVPFVLSGYTDYRVLINNQQRGRDESVPTDVLINLHQECAIIYKESTRRRATLC